MCKEQRGNPPGVSYMTGVAVNQSECGCPFDEHLQLRRELGCVTNVPSHEVIAKRLSELPLVAESDIPHLWYSLSDLDACLHERTPVEVRAVDPGGQPIEHAQDSGLPVVARRREDSLEVGLTAYMALFKRLHQKSVLRSEMPVERDLGRSCGAGESVDARGLDPGAVKKLAGSLGECGAVCRRSWHWSNVTDRYRNHVRSSQAGRESPPQSKGGRVNSQRGATLDR
jgi:hypothetical protein